MQRLTRDVAEVAERREEVTRAQAATRMARAHTTQVEGMAQENVVLLATTHDEAAEATHRVSILEGELATTHQAKDAAEEKISSLEAKVAAANQWQEAIEEQCEHLVPELTLLSIWGSKLCIPIIGVPPLTPLREGMHLVAAQHTEVATRLSALWVVVTPAVESILGRLPVNVPHVCVIGEIVVQFWE
jgi:hypothetical protein